MRAARRPRDAFLRMLDDHELRLRRLERALRLGRAPATSTAEAPEQPEGSTAGPAEPTPTTENSRE